MIGAIKKCHYDAYIPSYDETDYEGISCEIERDDLISVKIKDNPPMERAPSLALNFK